MLDILSGGELEQKRSELERLESEISDVERSLEGTLIPSAVVGHASIANELVLSNTKPLTKSKMFQLIEKELGTGPKVPIKEEEVRCVERIAKTGSGWM